MHVTPTLVSEQDALVPGETAWLGLDLKIESGWHIYWPGVNDTGSPPELQVTAPDGFKIGQTQWPAPHRSLANGGILDHTYEGRVLLLIPVDVPKDAKPGSSAAFSVKVSWVVCSDVCIAEKGSTGLTLPITALGTKPKASPDAPRFESTRLRIPKPLKKDSGTTARVDERTFIIESPGATKLCFFPLDGSATMPHLAKEGEAKGSRLTIQLDPDSNAHVKGVIEVESNASKQPAFYSVDLEVPLQTGKHPDKPAK
jgi:thiol:disulfide interchange protein DsbD